MADVGHVQEEIVKRIVDLSHPIVPGKAGRKFETTMLGAEEVNPDVVRLEGQWYIMHDIRMVSHVGTHIEAPYHILKDGEDLAALPLERLCGEAVVLDLRNVPPGSGISVEQVRAAAERAGGIRPGDIVLGHLGYSRLYGTPAYAQAPYFTTEAIEWLVQAGMKLMGVDASGVEIPGDASHANHHALFDSGIPLIENMAGLSQLGRDRVEVYALPVAVEGLESFPVRVVAVERD